METNIQFVKLPTSNYLENFVQKKLGKLSNRYDWVMRADVFFKQQKDLKGKGKICEIHLRLPGPEIVASSNEESFEAATDETIRDLLKQLKRRKSEIKPY